MLPKKNWENVAEGWKVKNPTDEKVKRRCHIVILSFSFYCRTKPICIIFGCHKKCNHKLEMSNGIYASTEIES